MEMDEEMEVEEECVVPVFEVVEIDLDYEFEAARFFDFCRRETEAEVRQAESWFRSAPGYPPSPAIANLFWRDDNVSTSSKSRGIDLAVFRNEEHVVLHSVGDHEEDSRDGNGLIQTILKDIRDGDVPSAQSWRQAFIAASCKGLTLCSQPTLDAEKTRSKPSAKPPLRSKSTLLKPTVCHLAKTSVGRHASIVRLPTEPVEKMVSSNSHFGGEVQASKRQKLNGGCSYKVGEIKQLSNLVHKMAKKDAMISGTSAQTKLNPTVPREPELETAFRAQRLRSKTKETESAATTTCRFKARPLNRKILEAPMMPIPKRSTPTLPEFQVFSLKTAERAIQHAATISSSSCSQNNKDSSSTCANYSLKDGKKDSKRPEFVHTSSKGDHIIANSFKAQPLDKRLFTSKGDIGVSKICKRDITIPKGFEFQTEKRTRQNPPVELFSKLSLASEVLPNSTGLKFRPACLRAKGLKENRFGSFQQDHNIQAKYNGATEHSHQARDYVTEHGGQDYAFISEAN